MKKILITTLFLCSLSALNAQTGPIHPKEPDFFTETKPEMNNNQYTMHLDMDFDLNPETLFLVEQFFEKQQNSFDFTFGICNVVNLPEKKKVTYTFSTNDPRTFVSVGLFLAFLNSKDK